MSDVEEKKPRKKLKKFTRIVWTLFLAGIIGLPLYIWAVSSNLGNLFGELPSYSQLENPKQNLSSLLYSADGVILGSYYRDNRNPVTYDELGPNLINALLAAEDIRFENHSGIDLESMGRVAYGVLTFSPKGGGSTISQQLAKQLFSTRVISDDEKGKLEGITGFLDQLIYKTKEWILAVRLERSYTKEEIMAMYYNTVEFSNNAHGIMSAAKIYFNKEPKDLAIQEAAVLAGMQKQVNGYRPDKYPERSKGRRNVVMNQMVKYGFLSKEAYDTLKVQDIVLDFKKQNHVTGQAQYFREEVKKDLLKIGREYDFDLFADGIRVYTTIDSRMQAHAEKALDSTMRNVQRLFMNSLKESDGSMRDPWIDKDGRVIKDFIEEQALPRTQRYRSLVKKYGKDSDSVDYILNKAVPMKVFSWAGEIDTLLSPIDSLKYYKHFLHGGFMAADPHTGQIKAWVGDVDFKYFKFDHVRHGKRQPGSLFKPMVYAKAVENGYSPCDVFYDRATTVNIPGYEPWTPKNSDRTGYTGEAMPLKRALAKSVNSISAQIIAKVKPENATDMVKRLGIQSDIQPFPSMVLGTQDVSLHEIVGAYGTFVNKGTYIEPHFITRIEDRFGNILYSKVPQKKKSISEQTAYVMLNMLQETVKVGSGRRLDWEYQLLVRSDSNQIGAKTGTTQNSSDGWFMAVTKDLVVGAWVGGDDRAIHFKNWAQGQGALTALPIVGRFLQKSYDDPEVNLEKGYFPLPDELDIIIDCPRFDILPDTRDSVARDSVIFEDDIYRPY
ncbi:MAG: penicillin-binding protein [Roseivirga sp.]|nr:penicillin-binding protein [Roseivirga sp.]